MPHLLAKLPQRLGASPATTALLGALVPALLAAMIGCGGRTTGLRPGVQDGGKPTLDDSAAPEPAPAGEGRPDQQGPTVDAAYGGPLFEREQLLGDPYGLRSRLEDAGLTVEALYVGDFTKNFRGGLSTRGYNYLDLLDVSLTADLGDLAGVPGGVVFADFQNTHGSSLSGDVGDVQGVDNIETDGRTQLAQVYYQQTIGGDDFLVVAAGKIDANARFAVAENAGEFVNSSPGQSPTIFALPAYPDPAFGAQAFVQPGQRFYAGVGFFDGAAQRGVPTGSRGPRSFFYGPADYFLVAEAGPRYLLGPGKLPGRVGVGVWYQTGTLGRLDGGSDDGTAGAYATFDQSLYQDLDEDGNPLRAVGLYGQYGYADANLSEIDHHVGGGVVATGLIPGRGGDAQGAGANYVHLSGDGGFADNYELSFEVFYKLQLTPAISVKPDLQYVVNPGGGGDAGDALVGIVRVEIAF